MICSDLSFRTPLLGGFFGLIGRGPNAMISTSESESSFTLSTFLPLRLFNTSASSAAINSDVLTSVTALALSALERWPTMFMPCRVQEVELFLFQAGSLTATFWPTISENLENPVIRLPSVGFWVAGGNFALAMDTLIGLDHIRYRSCGTILECIWCSLYS